MKEFDRAAALEMLCEHKAFFQRGETHELDFRIRQLEKLQQALHRYESSFLQALQQDLGKGEYEAYVTEIGFVYRSLRHLKQNLRRMFRPKRIKTPLYLWPASSHILREPYGTVLIIGPFNYPFQLLIEPLIGAIAGGNCAVVKPSENTPHVAALMEKMIEETFSPAYIRVVCGDRDITSALIHTPFDYIFFTGSVPVGKVVMQAAAENLVPVTLELGGKSPAIVEATADLQQAARRIVWGKFLNAGQTCIAPDYVLVDEKVQKELISHLKRTVAVYFGENAQKSPDFGRIVNERQFDRLAALVQDEETELLLGGGMQREDLFIEPTLVAANSWDAPAMRDEIFGPILPIMSYQSLDQAVKMVRDHPKPLALYLFTRDKQVEKQLLTEVSFGGGCVNDTILHIANPHLPFGGVGSSGMGFYHGKYSFELFTHPKSVVKKSGRFDTGLMNPPYRDKVKWIRKILK